MKLIVGLGNVGENYADTYHNVGFMALDIIAERLNAPAFSVKNNAYISDASVSGEKVFLIKPTTFMNKSGDAVCYFSRYYKIEPKDILVLYDDIDIGKGAVRARLSGSAGTHNGMRDIVAKLGSTDFARVRIGTGPKPAFMDLIHYVMVHIPAVERPLLDKAFAAAADFALEWAAGKEWQTLTVNVAI